MSLPATAPPPVLVAPWTPRLSAPQPVHDDGVTGNVSLIQDFPSQGLHNERDLMVYLPPGYDAPGNDRHYTVVYAQDGQNLFDPKTSAFGHEWHLDEWAQNLIAAGKMDNVIIVGIYNTPDRIPEYTAVPDPKYGGGNGNAYENFLIHELKPWVDSHYRTQPDAAHTAIMGSSLGGLVALDAGLRHPDVFGKVAALSPSLWWDNQQMADEYASAPPGAGPQEIWIDMGTQEGDDPATNVEDARKMHEVLKQRGYVDGQTLFYREVQGGTHNEDSWANVSGDVLQTLFPPQP